ncbi:ComEC/Rec2 family competence protein [Nonomuraea guangzhouensis]|uniref:ComEC/Rec2 family competence protein n=1 Tax=Nonomuraea guangzhouensis TaxID=1291555 RepID=A0ABW4GRK3_9ACTN|nr:hypothetical protein [Nonomuraea guangzhouensis]
MIYVEALPAYDGDCLWVEWTHRGAFRRMVIDGGRGTVLLDRLRSLPIDDRHVDLIVCTHIDVDHIEGLITLFARLPAGFSVGEVWFNGHRHLTRDVTGPRQGERLEMLLDKAGVPWNAAFGGSAVVVPDRAEPPIVRLAGLTLTLLAPDWDALARLDAFWPEAMADLIEPLQGRRRLVDDDATRSLTELAGEAYTPDKSPANGSSIAFIAEHEHGGRVLFTGDSPAEALLRGLRRLAGQRRVPVDLCKVPHHGSARNLSAELVSTLDCSHWLFSTSGARHGHPDRRAVARIVAQAPRSLLVFNYHSLTTAAYADDVEADRHGFRALFPPSGLQGITVRVTVGQVDMAGSRRPML